MSALSVSVFKWCESCADLKKIFYIKRKSKDTNQITYKAKGIHAAKEQEENEKIFWKTIISYIEKKKIDFFCSTIGMIVIQKLF